MVASEELDHYPTLDVGDISRDRHSEYGRLFFDKTHWFAPVLALTIIREIRESQEILAVVRNGATNPTHPNVVSTPTIRVPVSTFIDLTVWEWLKTQTPDRHTYERDTLDTTFPENEDYPNVPDSRSYYVGSLLSQKLGVADIPDFDYSCAVESLTLGTAHYDFGNGNEVDEHIAMVNMSVGVPKNVDFSPKTSSYSDVRWVDVEEFSEMHTSKNLFPVYGSESVELCMHGMCIATSLAVIEDIT